MFRKLLKYEWTALMRTMFPVYGRNDCHVGIYGSDGDATVL